MRLTLTALGIALALATAAPGSASAAPITYNITLTATSGPLAGEIASGSFTFDSASIVPGDLNTNEDLFTDLAITFGGVSYTEATVNTGFLAFDAAGTLINATFGTDCFAGGCFVSSAEFVVYGSSFAYGDGAGTGSATRAVAAVPEPASALLLGAGLLGLATVRRRTRV